MIEFEKVMMCPFCDSGLLIFTHTENPGFKWWRKVHKCTCCKTEVHFEPEIIEKIELQSSEQSAMEED